jgi:23S rRNA (adenine2503-C2)-methyltransferase
MSKNILCGLTHEEIFDLIRPSGFNSVHAVAISNSIYKKKIADIQQIAKIPSRLKVVLENCSDIGIFPPADFQVSADKSIKYLFLTRTGKKFETVYIPENKRNTICVSTQSGCRMGCQLCVTGKYGFHGNLSAGEIINQIIGIPDLEKVTHVVFMGMGEPMDNLENVLKACEIITAGWGLAISPRNVTVSTVGITSGVKEFLMKSGCNLTLSLYSPFAGERKKVIPAEKNYPADQIIDIMKSFPVKKSRRLSLAYVMIRDLNDSDNHLEGIKTILKDTKIRVNLLPYHPVGKDKNISSSAERMQYFKHNLIVSGISASVRKSRGIDISAACGLLATKLID